MSHNNSALTLVSNLRVMPRHNLDENATDAEIRARMKERFYILDAMTHACIDGLTRSMIVSGPPGLGKTHTIEKVLDAYDTTGAAVGIVKGFSRATGLYKALWKYRHDGCVLMFDDADSVFYDETALNLLKAVADTTERRRVSWLSEGRLLDDDGAVVPKNFEFQGAVIFVTNLDFDQHIYGRSKISRHIAAIMSRSHYLDMGIKTKRELLLRIRQVVEEGMLDELDDEARRDVIEYIEFNHEKLRELSLRSAVKLAKLRSGRSDWRRIANVTLCV